MFNVSTTVLILIFPEFSIITVYCTLIMDTNAPKGPKKYTRHPKKCPQESTLKRKACPSGAPESKRMRKTESASTAGSLGSRATGASDSIPDLDIIDSKIPADIVIKTARQRKTTIVHFLPDGSFEMYCIPKKFITRYETKICTVSHLFSKSTSNKTKLEPWEYAQLTLNFLNPKDPNLLDIIDKLQTLYMAKKTIKYPDVGKWIPFCNQRSSCVFVIRKTIK